MYPAVLPAGYIFTNFEVTDFGTELEILVYASDPYIAFRVLVGANMIVNDYSHEANGIKYNVSDLGDGLYQAQWTNGTDYYTIVVSDNAILSEIIKNLKET
jgi:hypothetical protein